METLFNVVFAVVLVGAAVLLSIHSAKQSAKEDAADRLDRDERASRPKMVIAVNGETALVERYDGSRFDVANPFVDLDAGMWVELNYNCTTVIDFIQWRYM